MYIYVFVTSVPASSSRTHEVFYHDSPCPPFSALSQCFGPLFFSNSMRQCQCRADHRALHKGMYELPLRGKGKLLAAPTTLVKWSRFPQHPFGEQRSRVAPVSPSLQISLSWLWSNWTAFQPTRLCETWSPYCKERTGVMNKKEKKGKSMYFYEVTALGQLYRDWVSVVPAMAFFFFFLSAFWGGGCQPMGPAQSPPTPPHPPSSQVHQHQVTPTSPRFAPSFPGPGQGLAHGALLLISVLAFLLKVGAETACPWAIPPWSPSLSPCSPQGQGQAVPKRSQLPRPHGSQMPGLFRQRCQTRSDRSLGPYER